MCRVWNKGIPTKDNLVWQGVLYSNTLMCPTIWSSLLKWTRTSCILLIDICMHATQFGGPYLFQEGYLSLLSIDLVGLNISSGRNETRRFSQQKYIHWAINRKDEVELLVMAKGSKNYFFFVLEFFGCLYVVLYWLFHLLMLFFSVISYLCQRRS